MYCMYLQLYSRFWLGTAHAPNSTKIDCDCKVFFLNHLRRERVAHAFLISKHSFI